MLVVIERILDDPARFAAFVTKLLPETQVLVRVPPRDNEWIPLHISRDLIETSYTHAFGEDLHKTFELGRLSQHEGISALFKLFVAAMRPNHVLSLVSAIWSSYYRGNGTVQAFRVARNVADLWMREVEIGSPRYWEMIRGTLFAFGEATRVDDLAVVTVEQDERAARFRVSWR